MNTTTQLSQEQTSQQLIYWLALSRIPGVGPTHLKYLLKCYPDLTDLFRCNRQDLKQLMLSEPVINALLKPDWSRAEQDWQWGQQANHLIISWNDHHYPPLLKEIATAPPLLFLRGNVTMLSSPQIAIVGSRNPSHLGLENAHYFANQLIRHGFAITSGLALGIDAASHQGAINAQGTTIAVMATGCDVVYPRRHQALANLILEKGGSLISEFPPGTPPLREHFPRRNRLISGLSLGVLVVEAALQSGSLITARCANEQGREVFAIPGSIRNPLTKGNHELIRQGAKLVDKIEDILEELKFSPIYTISEPIKFNSGKLLNQQQQNLMHCIEKDATPLELLLTRSGLAVNNAIAMLSELEIAGYIKTVPGGFIRLT